MYLSRARGNLSLVTAMSNEFKESVFRKCSQLSIAAAFLLSTTGCAGKPQAAISPSHMEAINHNQHGIRAESRGESRQALGEFAEALRVNSSIENTEGVVVALVNSSRVHRHLGDADSALSTINRAIPLITHQSPLYAEVAFEVAQARLLAGKTNEAAEWAAKAAVAEKGNNRGMRINLLARLLYLQGNMAEAESRAREALLLTREKELREEEANSLRLLGDIQAADKRTTEAAESYSQALDLDKAIGKSKKIAADLRGLALLSLVRSEPDHALGFYQRAFAVSSTSGDLTGAADDLLEMALIHEKRGEKEMSDRLLAEREKLLQKPVTP